MIMDRLACLRTRMNVEHGMPLIAVPAADQAQADAIRQAGGLALSPLARCVEDAQVSQDGIIAFDAATVSASALRQAYPDIILLDCGAARDEATAQGLCAADVDGVSVGSMGYGDNGGTPRDRDLLYILQRTEGLSTPVISGGVNAVRALGLFENLGDAAVFMVVHRGVCEHFDGIAAGLESLKQAAQCHREGGRVFAFAQEYPVFARAFESFSSDADALYPGWRSQLGL